MNRHPVTDEVEGIASIAPPVPVPVLAEILGLEEAAVVEAVEELETTGRATASRHGVHSSDSRLSATRLTHFAGRLADILARDGGSSLQLAQARLAAGDPRSAHQAALTVLEDPAATSEERAIGLDLAIAAGREARIAASELAPRLVDRARLHRTRGEHALAVADLEAATPHLEGDALVDAYGFAAAVLDDRQQPSDGERVVAMGLSVAARHGLDAKLGSLLTFQGRLLARLGFDAESERVFDLGSTLVDAHGTAVQRHYAALNRAWTDLDRGWVARAESGYGAARGRIGDDPVAGAEIDIAIARAKFSTGDGTGAVALLDGVDRIADETAAPVLRFLATLARAEGAIAFRQPMVAVEHAARLAQIVEEDFPAWRNRAATVEARALLLANRRAEAREAVARGLAATPRGANGLRLRTELEALSAMAAERWDDEAATDVADRLLQGGWVLAAVQLLTERSRRERRTDLGRAAAALAHRIGAPLAAAEAIEAAGIWDEPAAGPVALAIRRVAQTVPTDWSESWHEEPAIAHALAAESAGAGADDEVLLSHLDATLTRAGLSGADVVLSPAQRRTAGLVTSGSRAMSMGRFVAFVAAAGIVAAIVAIALRPEPVEIPVTAPTTTVVTTTTLPPLVERVVEPAAELSGQAAFSGGDGRNAVFAAQLGEPTGIYWSSQLTGFVRSEPVLRGRGLYVGDSEGWVYGLDITQDGAVVFESQLSGAIDTSPTVEQVDFGQDAQGKTLVFTGDDRGTLLIRHVNDTEGEVTRLELGSPITGPPLVRAQSMVVATEDGRLLALAPADGSELARFPADDTQVEGGFTGPLAADGTHIYARTGEGAVVVLDEATLTEVCTVFTPGARATTHPVVDGERWYVGTSARTVRMFRTGSCSDAGIGSLQIDTPMNFAPVVADGVLWAVADAVLLPLDVETGLGIDFAVSAGGTVTAPPVVAGDDLLFVTEAGDLVAVNRADGAERWRVSFGTPIRTRPIVGDGIVIVATSRGDVVALAVPS